MEKKKNRKKKKSYTPCAPCSFKLLHVEQIGWTFIVAWVLSGDHMNIMVLVSCFFKFEIIALRV